MRRERESSSVRRKSGDEQRREMNLALHEAISIFLNVGLGRGSVEFGKDDGGELPGCWESGWQ